MSEVSAARVFAVIPAAGLSRRMGQPKLLLTLGQETVIKRLLRVLGQPTVHECFVVARASDSALADEVRRCGATLVQPESDPPDMRDSVSIAVDEIERQLSPNADDGWLLVPADHPVLDSAVVEQLLTRWGQTDADILVPTFNEKRGHPTLFRWRLAQLIDSIPEDRGLNWLVRESGAVVEELPLESETVLMDLDTPDDYAALQAAMTKQVDES